MHGPRHSIPPLRSHPHAHFGQWGRRPAFPSLSADAERRTILKAAAKRSSAPSHLKQLLQAASPSTGRAPTQRGLVEPLSERELQVLRLLRGDLAGPEIANELVVSLNTVRTHTKNIYAKLGVTSRREAVRRAEELGLF